MTSYALRNYIVARGYPCRVLPDRTLEVTLVCAAGSVLVRLEADTDVVRQWLGSRA